MAAEKAFQDVLDYISKSSWNFSIYQTPFSAQLSLKKSFAEHFQNDDQYEVKRLIDEETSILKQNIEMNEDLIHNLETKCKTLEHNLKVEKKKNKKERQKAEHNVVNEPVCEVKLEIDSENEADISDVPVYNRFTLLAKLEIERVKKNSFITQTETFECEICSGIFSTEANFKDHKEIFHKETSESFSQTSTVSFTSKFQQTDDANENFANCFYCGKLIDSELSLLEHVSECHGWKKRKSFTSNSNLPVQNQCTQEQSQWLAIKLMLKQMETPKVPCEICNQEFESEGFVKCTR